MKDISAIVLAAGLGKRMKSMIPKVLHPLCGRPMLSYPTGTLRELRVEKVVIVVGHGAERVKDSFRDADAVFVTQERQLGTGHAVLCAEEALRGFSGDVVILSGDVPLITRETLKRFIAFSRRKKAILSFMTAMLDDPTGYGRVLRDEDGMVQCVVEERDATPFERAVKEINAGIYMVRSDFLFDNLKKVNRANAQGEYYLPDLIPLALRKGRPVAAMVHHDAAEIMGVNNRVDLAKASKALRKRINERLMLGGVTMIDPETVYVEGDIKIGRDTTIYPNVVIEDGTSIGVGCVIEENCRISGSAVGAETIVKSGSAIEGSRIGARCSIGPFARLRPGNVISHSVKIGNFVEVKKSRIGSGTKANHLSYIGDAVIGKDVNIGAGTITCNYDGIKKHTTIIKDGAFIGSDTQLVAPVTVGKGAYVGSGSTVTRDVPPGSLALTRAEQRIVTGWVEKKGGGVAVSPCAGS